MRKRIDRVLLDRQTIADRVADMADEIAMDFAAEVGEHNLHSDNPPELTLVPILTGSIIFLADLIRNLPLMMRIRMLQVSSYPGKSTSSQTLMLPDQLPDDFGAKHVLIIDDILDSGRTISEVRNRIAKQKPASLKFCVLLRKQIPKAMSVHAEYVGFDIPDAFVVGYGLDFDGYYRNLPEVVTLKPEAMR